MQDTEKANKIKRVEVGWLNKLYSNWEKIKGNASRLTNNIWQC